MTTMHPWLASYPDGVRWGVGIEAEPVQKILDDTAAKWPDRPALEFMGKRICYRELQELANRAAKGCRESASGRESTSACSCRTRRTT